MNRVGCSSRPCSFLKAQAEGRLAPAGRVARPERGGSVPEGASVLPDLPKGNQERK